MAYKSFRYLSSRFVFSLRRIIPFWAALNIFVFALLFFFLPVYLSHFVSYRSVVPLALFSFYALNIAITVGIYRSFVTKENNLAIKQQDLTEEINISRNRTERVLAEEAAHNSKIQRYMSLRNIIEEINRNLESDFVTNKLADIAHNLIAHEKGTCILYLADTASQKLTLHKTRKEDKKLVIKEKEGDIFDQWVLRHSSPLIVEDVHKDFRFDLDRIKESVSRPVRSLISAPFISEHTLLGVLRLDSPLANTFTQDDLRLLVTISDIGAVAIENSMLFQRMQELATHDGLTSLFTKGFFMQRLREECRRSLRNNHPLSLLMLDIDFFKKYNDSFGHMTGDAVLRKLSSILQDFTKGREALLGRFGGEEFCVALPQMGRLEAAKFADELRRKVEQERIVFRRQETSISVSIGVAELPHDATEDEDLIMKADRALLEAKRKGRNRVVCA